MKRNHSSNKNKETPRYASLWQRFINKKKKRKRNRPRAANAAERRFAWERKHPGMSPLQVPVETRGMAPLNAERGAHMMATLFHSLTVEKVGKCYLQSFCIFYFPLSSTGEKKDIYHFRGESYVQSYVPAFPLLI